MKFQDIYVFVIFQICYVFVIFQIQSLGSRLRPWIKETLFTQPQGSCRVEQRIEKLNILFIYFMK